MLRANTIALTGLLALLTAFGPISTDMYVPSMPDVGRTFATGASGVQLTISSYLVGFAVGQILHGPMGDRFGRKTVLLLSLVLFCGATAACALAPNIETLIVTRALQALGCAGIVTIPRAMVRDLYTGVRAASELSRMGAIMSFVPVVAPLAGGLVQLLFGWRANFVAVVAVGVFATVIVWLWLPETLQHRSGAPISVGGVLQKYRMLLGDRSFRAHVGIAACSHAGLFAWISASSFILQGLYDLSAFQFGVVYAVACLGSLAGGTVAAAVVARLGLARTIGIGAAILMAGGVAMAGLVTLGLTPVIALMVPMFVYHIGYMLVTPSAIAGATMPYPDCAGTACSLVGFMQQVSAAAVGIAVGRALGHTAWPLAIAVLLMGTLSLAFWMSISAKRMRGDRMAAAPQSVAGKN